MKVIHYGSVEYMPELVKPVKNAKYGWVKPDSGGLWCSPVDSKYGWKEWCKENNFRDCDESISFTLEINHNARVLKIDSYSDLARLPHINNDNFNDPRRYLDFEKLCLHYDAIWLTEKGQWETRLTEPYQLYGWDCESVLIMNPNSCKQIKSIT